MNIISDFIKDVQGHKCFTKYIHGDAKHTTNYYDDWMVIFISQKLEDNRGRRTDEYEVEDELKSII